MMDNHLPIYQFLPQITHALQTHQVVVIAGETGSGKSTQLPQICLQLGRGQASKWIGHTQPRRLAARNIAARVAEELESIVGEKVGCKIRFQDQVSDQTQIKLMTDGILLNEIQQDPLLRRYDTLIIDEAHERSLNIDFILGYLKRLLPKRPDLKLIITSATLDHQRFAQHFTGAEIIEVSGRGYPIAIEYAPLSNEEGEEVRDPLQGIIDAVEQLNRLGRGDILVFLPTERDIREIEEGLNKQRWMSTEIVPLYGRLTNAQQQRVFYPGQQRRVILSTNVAETSVTVPRVHYVIDSGVVRISRYSPRSKVQRLPIEPISQASANQRAGRCGRIAPGTCIRLYSKNDFLQRPEFTEPEILRTNLASVILQMIYLQLGPIEEFPFLDQPDSRLVQDGYRLLQELGALDERRELTAIGRKMVRLPVDPRLARMLVAAEGKPCVREVLLIVSALSLQDPRERPIEKQQAADQAHRVYAHVQSDFLSFVQLWDHFNEETASLSNARVRQYCQKNFLSYLRMREWRDIVEQLGHVLKNKNEKNTFELKDLYAPIHQCLATGLLSHIGQWQENNEYLGARQQKWQIFPGSILFKKSTPWVMAAELVETQQTYARCVAKIDPAWLEPLARHLIKRSYFEPHFEKQRQHVVAFEKVILYGLEIVAKRKVNYGPIDPVLSRELFIREGIVSDQLNATIDFVHYNQQLLLEIETLEHRARKRDIVVDEQVLIDFYNKHLPDDAYDTVRLQQWVKTLTADQRKILYLDQATLMQRHANEITAEAYPTQIKFGAMTLAVSYHFDPSAEDDGVTLRIPLALLPQVTEEPPEWLVPGMLLEKITTLLRCLPKTLRRLCIPVPEYAQACFDALSTHNHQQSLYFALAEALSKIIGVNVPADSWGEAELPVHLFMNFALLDEASEVLEQSRDLAELKNNWSKKLKQDLSQKTIPAFNREHIQQWDFGDLPASIEMAHQGATMILYPALCVEKDRIALRAFPDQAEAATAHHHGLVRLLMLQGYQPIAYLKQHWNKQATMVTKLASVQDKNALWQDFIDTVFARTFVLDQPEIRQHIQFIERLQQKDQLVPTGEKLIAELNQAVQLYPTLMQTVSAKQINLTQVEAYQDIRQQLVGLFYPGFIEHTPKAWLQRYPVYLKAIEHRLQKLRENPSRDQQAQRQFAAIWAKYQRWLTMHHVDPLNSEPRWWLEEFRIALFAQHLKTAVPVSDKRLMALLT